MIKCIWIEIRPALRCCHVCVVLIENISKLVKISVKKSNLVLRVNGKDFSVNFKDFVVEPLTMTGFKASNQFLSFRVQGECTLKLESVGQPKLQPPSIKDEKISLSCQCDNHLTNETIFDRVLPLPSNEVNPSDLFCHLHDGQSSSSLVPRLNDCLYSDHFLLVHHDIITGCLKRGKFLKCKRCLGTVGTCDTNSGKFWTVCIKFPSSYSSPLQQFKHLVWKAISNPFSMFPKLLLECEESQNYLSVVIVDKNLVVSSCEENLELKTSQMVKLKYMFHSSCDSFVRSLRDDFFHSLHIQVHKSLIDFSLQFLVSSSQNIPPIFSRLDKELLAYLNLDDLSQS